MDNTHATADHLRIDGLHVHAIIGVQPFEREHEQPIELDLRLWLNLQPAAESADLTETMDYTRIGLTTGFVLRSARFRLLEEAASCIAAMQLAPGFNTAQARAHRAAVVMRKPNALQDLACGGIPSVAIRRQAVDFAAMFETISLPFGRIQTLFRNRRCHVYSVAVLPGKTFHTSEPPHSVLVQGDTLSDGTGALVDTQVLHPSGEFVLSNEGSVVQGTIAVELCG